MVSALAMNRNGRIGGNINDLAPDDRREDGVGEGDIDRINARAMIVYGYDLGTIAKVRPDDHEVVSDLGS